MAKASFTCSKCKRTFSMAAHLARHKNTIHGAKSRRTSAAKKVSKARRVARRKAVYKKRRGRIPVIAGAGRFLRDMRAYHSDLIAQHSSLTAKIDAIAGAMQALGSAAPASLARSSSKRRKKRGRPAGSSTRRGLLKDYIVRVLSKQTKPIGPHDIGARVMKSGFKTKAKDITKAVSNTLPKVKNLKKVGFGLYLLASR